MACLYPSAAFPSSKLLMAGLLILSLVPLSSSLVPVKGFPRPKIVGGTAATGTQFPFAAFGIVKGYDTTQTPSTFLEACSGSLITDYSSISCTSNSQCSTDEKCVAYIDGNSYCQSTWVMTAGHCLFNGFSTTPISGYNVPQFIFGNADRTASTDTTGLCTEIFIHPLYDTTTQYYDISLCKLGGTATALNRGVLAYGNDTAYTSGGLVTVIGWGRTADNPSLNVETVLRYVNLHTSTNAACQADLNTRLPALGDDDYDIISAQLCAGGTTFGDSGKDSCQGDSGGPLFLEYQDGTPYILGATSEGWGCAKGPPGVYTRVTAIADWVIASQVCSREYKTSGVCSTTCSFLNQTGNTITCYASGTPAPTSPPTQSPTLAPSTLAPTTMSPTTRSPTTSAPTTFAPSTRSPTTTGPTTFAPTTSSPVTSAPTTLSPTTSSPITSAPTTLSPTTLSPTTGVPTQAPTTGSPSTISPTTAPSTTRPSFSPSTTRPSFSPTPPPTSSPTTSSPTRSPTTSPTTQAPTAGPTTTAPTTAPTTKAPLAVPTTRSPTARPTTRAPTGKPTLPPTNVPTTRSPTAKPTTHAPIPKPTTKSPILKPTTKSPTEKPTRPPTIAPTTKFPTAKPTTRSPTAKPTTRSPTTKPTTRSPTARPTTRSPV